MTLSLTLLLGGAFVLAMMGQSVLALVYLFGVFAGGLTDSQRILFFLLLMVSAWFTRIQKAG